MLGLYLLQHINKFITNFGKINESTKWASSSTIGQNLFLLLRLLPRDYTFRHYNLLLSSSHLLHSLKFGLTRAERQPRNAGEILHFLPVTTTGSNFVLSMWFSKFFFSSFNPIDDRIFSNHSVSVRDKKQSPHCSALW